MRAHRRLTGADCFLRAFDAETRRWAGASHLSQLVLRLGPGFDAARFEAAVAAVARANPIVHAPVRRPGGFGLPVFDLARAARTPLPTIERHRHDGPPPGAAPPPVLQARLNARLELRRGELLRFDWVAYDPQAPIAADVVMTWAHLLFDATGSELFVAHLDRVFRGEAEPALACADLPAPHAAWSWGRRGRTARAWGRGLGALGQPAPRSLAGPRARVPQALGYDVETLPPERTARVERRAGALAGPLTPMAFYLAAAIRAHHAVHERRGAVPASYVVPVVVNRRAKGGAGPVFQTRVSMLWFRVLAGIAGDMEALVRTLLEQRLAAIKAGAIEQAIVAMDVMRFVPSRLYARLARSAFRGELASFFFAYTDAFLPGLERFCGAEIVRGFHAPSVPPSPGSSLIFSRHRGRLNLTHVHQHGLLDDAEHALMHRRLAADLEGEGPA